MHGRRALALEPRPAPPHPLLLLYAARCSGWVALIYGPILLVSVLLHELGHSLAARRCGSETHGILLWPLGGLAFIGHSSGPKGACRPGPRKILVVLQRSGSSCLLEHTVGLFSGGA